MESEINEIQVRNLKVPSVEIDKPFEISFEVINNGKSMELAILELYIDDKIAGHVLKFLDQGESQKIKFAVNPEDYDINSKNIVIKTKNGVVLATHPINFSKSENSSRKMKVDEKIGEENKERFPEFHDSSKEIVRRVKSGIIGLDEKMEGGFVENSMNLITGKTGTGKTAFAASFIYQGAKEGEAGVYLTTEERREDIKEDIKAMFGWDFDELEKRNLLKIISMKPVFPSQDIENLGRLVRSYITNLLNDLEESIKKINAKRVVIDSVSIIEMFIKDEYLARVALASLMNNLREMKVTTLLVGTVPETSEGLSGGGIIEFLVDTVIKLEFMPIAEDYKRTLTIRKMRRTDHSVQIMPIKITKRGLEIINV